MAKGKLTKEEYFQTIGILAQRAALADSYLFAAFSLIAKMPKGSSRAVYYAADSFAIRKAMVRRVVEVLSPKDLSDFDELAEAVRKANNKRNELAHSTMFVSQTDQTVIFMNLKNMNQRTRPVTRAYLDALLAESLKYYQEAGNAMGRIVMRNPLPPVSPEPRGESYSPG